MRFREEYTKTGNRRVFNRLHRWHICNQTGKCDYCPMHNGENFGRRPRPDRYKNHRRH